MVVFGPWAFGTTQPWSIWTMNAAGYVLGALWLLKRGTAWLQGFNPSPSGPAQSMNRGVTPPRVSSSSIAVLGMLTVLLLLYCLISALNARASFNPQTATLDYHDTCLRWLPHSFDRPSTWFAFWTYLALACSFWSIRDWLQGGSLQEQWAAGRAERAGGAFDYQPEHRTLPLRLCRLLTVLTVNGGLVAAESIVQRLANCPKLLFLVTPEIHRTAITQFGPYAYQANGAQYLNLLWPVCLGFWWTLLAGKISPPKFRYSIFMCTGFIAAAALMSASRGGVFVGISLLFITTLYLLTRVRFLPLQVKEATFVRRYAPALLLAPVVAAALGWHELKPRKTGLAESWQRRQRIYEVARNMAKEFGVFGSGPGTYANVSALYLPETPGFWPAQVHNDWLETRITFGFPGTVLVISVLAAIGLLWLGGRDPYEFVFLSGLALAGCLAHARFDFPFQVHSILFLFVVISAIVCVVSSRSPGAPPSTQALSHN